MTHTVFLKTCGPHVTMMRLPSKLNLTCRAPVSAQPVTINSRKGTIRGTKCGRNGESFAVLPPTLKPRGRTTSSVLTLFEAEAFFPRPSSDRFSPAIRPIFQPGDHDEEKAGASQIRTSGTRPARSRRVRTLQLSLPLRTTADQRRASFRD